MTDLSTMHCVPCEGGVEPLGSEAITDYLEQTPGWEVVEEDGEKRLRRAYEFESFARALELTDRIGAAAEEQGHHPVLVTEWGKVTVTWWTHAIGGLHDNDFVMAAKSDEIYRDMTG
ncbi:MAG: 4a-hydroxytetrahydrobiopterin dehydratase [Acidobacteriota bacterium]|jgi:4a-hydroxytetrahydrobiopterin dehydratase